MERLFKHLRKRILRLMIKAKIEFKITWSPENLA